ncbi:MAG: nucleotide modification associated domain-containing protein [Aerococcus sp.]|nr:nucleotide modification associated domain-containing protein [Aerococcus sp.]
MQEIFNELLALYEAKNKDYGDSFTQSLDEFGLVAGVVRLNDKMNRIKSIVKSGTQEVSDESLIDTLKDDANYAVMMIQWLRNRNQGE